jgi:general secretion pathway protein I
MTSYKRATIDSKKGFTLLEVMIAVAVLAIALTSLFGSQSASVRLATESRFNIQAPLLARKQLAELTLTEDFVSGEGDFEDDFAGFRWELQVEEVFFEESEILEKLEQQLWHLTMIVRWGDNDFFTYQLDTYRQNVSDEE